MTIAELLRRATELENVSDSARLDVEVLLCHVLKKERTYLFTWPDHDVTGQPLAVFNTAFERRKNGEPVAHITGEREFWSLKLSVNNSTLIPRPDTELLVEQSLQLPLPENTHVLDLGTGTGAIALALASEQPHWQITAVDVVDEAVALAERNRQQLQLNNVQIAKSSWYQQLSPDRRFHLIVSNPPYIDPVDPHLSQGDVRFEPQSALTAANHGLADIEIIAAGAQSFLEDEGFLLVEHGYDQGEQVRTVFAKQGFNDVHTVQDLANNDRVTIGRYSRP